MKKLRPENTRLRLHGNNNEAQKLRTFAMRKLQGFLSTCNEDQEVCGPWKVEFSDGSWIKLSQLFDQPVIDIYVPEVKVDKEVREEFERPEQEVKAEVEPEIEAYEVIFFYRWHLRRVDDSIISMEDLPPGRTVPFETSGPAGTFEWEMYSEGWIDGLGLYPWNTMISFLSPHPDDADAGWPDAFCYVKINADPDKILEFIEEKIVDSGIMEAAESDNIDIPSFWSGFLGIFAFNVWDERFYFFEKVLPDGHMRSGEHKGRTIWVQAEWHSQEDGGVFRYHDFYSLTGFAPTEEKSVDCHDKPVKYNNRWYTWFYPTLYDWNGSPVNDARNILVMPGVWVRKTEIKGRFYRKALDRARSYYAAEEYYMYLPMMDRGLAYVFEDNESYYGVDFVSDTTIEVRIWFYQEFIRPAGADHFRVHFRRWHIRDGTIFLGDCYEPGEPPEEDSSEEDSSEEDQDISMDVTCEGETVWSDSADSGGYLVPPDTNSVDFNRSGAVRWQKAVVEINFEPPWLKRWFYYRIDDGDMQEQFASLDVARPEGYTTPNPSADRDALRGVDHLQFWNAGGTSHALISFGSTVNPYTDFPE